MKSNPKTLKSVSSPAASFKTSNILLLVLSGLVNAFGVTFFIAPVMLYDSGISGTSILLSQITPPYLTLSLFLMVLNIPLFLFGWKKQGWVFTINAIIAVCSYSFFAWMINDVLPVDVSIASPLAGTDLLLCALFGGVISGIGSGMAIRYGGAMDGIDVVAVIFAGRVGLSIGTFVMIYNFSLYIICGFILHSWILPLYSIVTYYAASKAIDFLVEGIDRSKAIVVVTIRPQEVSQALSQIFGSGITTIQAHGYYSNSEKTVVCMVLHWLQIGRARDIAHAVDPGAFITISEVATVFSSPS